VDGDVRSSSGSVGALGYTGALTDASGLVYLNARSLDPGTGTFTSRDPETPGGPGVTGFNPYAYAGQNPTTLTDPSGRGDAIEFTETFVDVVEPTATTGEVAGEEISGGIETVAQDGGDAVESLPDETPTTPEAGDPGVGGSGEAGGGGSGDIGEPPAEGPGVGDGGDGGGGSGINTDQSLGCDPAHGGAFNPDEYQTALRVQQERGVWLTRSSDPALEWEDLAGNTYDAMGPIPQQYFDQELSNIEAQLATHLDKATYIPFDVTGLTPVQISVVQQLIAGYGPGVFIVGM
jgi:RHS repeat-associated protein